ncbi:MAG TPA: hypothetical protein VI756_25820 [Blastocatellia bacterium]
MDIEVTDNGKRVMSLINGDINVESTDEKEVLQAEEAITQGLQKLQGYIKSAWGK